MKKYVEPQAKSRSIAGSNTFENYLLSQELSATTVKHYHMHTMSFIAWCDTQHVETENTSAKEITGYIQHLKKRGNGNIACSVQLMALKHFFDYEIKHERRIDNPARHIKLRGTKQQKLYPILSRQELEAIYHNYELPIENDPRTNRNWFSKYKLSRQRNKVIIGLMIYQGLTTPEINNLKPVDVKLREGKIFIAGARKSAERTLELKPHQIMELMEYQLTTRTALLKLCAVQSEYYFISSPAAGKKTATGKSTLNAWKRLSDEVEKICTRFINFKQVRASVITHWLLAYNLRQVQYMAGHRYVSSTERYLVNQMEDLQSDIEKFHPIG